MSGLTFGGYENGKVIWEAKHLENEAMLQALKDGRYYLIVNDDENAKHIVFSRECAIELMQAIQEAETEQFELFG